MSKATFNHRDWVNRLGAALEQVAACAHPSGFPFRTEHLPNPGPIDLYDEEIHRQYRQLATRARRDPDASALFYRSSLRIETVPSDIGAILREHPTLKRTLAESGTPEGFHFQRILSGGHVDLTSLVSRLAKSSVKLGGKRVATMLHRYLVAGEHTRLHAHEIILLHGLIVDEHIDLGPGAYLASYEAAKVRFDLPDDPEEWLARSDLQPGRLTRSTALSVLVRSVSWGPGVGPCDCPTGNSQSLNVRYRFPDRYPINSVERFFHDRAMLIQLLSIATRSKLVSHTAFYVFPSWMWELDPNSRFRKSDSGASFFDVWPKDLPLSNESVTSFIGLARGWLSYPNKRRHAIELAIRRIVASFGPAAGMFGLEDRILDVAIALEIMYGPFDGGEITHKLRTRAAWLLGTSPEDRYEIVQNIKAFYEARSAVVHGSTKAERQKFERALPLGRELAHQTLAKLLVQGPVLDWDRLVVDGTQHDTTHCNRS